MRRWLGILWASNDDAIESGKCDGKQTVLCSLTRRTHHCLMAKNSGFTLGKSLVNKQIRSWLGLITSYPNLWKHPFMHDFDLKRTFFRRSVLTRIKPRPNSTPQTMPRRESLGFPRAIKSCTWLICLTNSVKPEWRLVFCTSVEIESKSDWYCDLSSSGSNFSISEFSVGIWFIWHIGCCGGRAIPMNGARHFDSIEMLRSS